MSTRKSIAPKGTRYLELTAREPSPGSVILLEGPTGTAYQHLFSTGRWHSSTQGLSTGYTWAEIKKKASRDGAYPMLLVFAAPDDDDALPNGLAPAGAAQLAEIEELVQLTGAPVDTLQPRTRSEAAALLLTLRAYRDEVAPA